jgi:hypothetical protein
MLFDFVACAVSLDLSTACMRFQDKEMKAGPKHWSKFVDPFDMTLPEN